METFLSLFEYGFFQNALLAAVLASISCGIIGTYIVSRRIVFVSGGITHASFGGIGIGYFMGINPVIGALVFSVLSAFGVEYLTRRAEIRNDSVIAMLWSLGMAIGIIFIYLTPGYSPNLMTYLFGSIVTVGAADLYPLLALTLILIFIFSFFHRLILFISFDEQFALTRKAPVQGINYLMLGLVALTIVLSIKIAGIILVISLLTIPQNAANLFSNQFKKIIIYSIVIGFAGSFSGLIISYFLDIPSGASIIFSLVIIYLFLRLFRVFVIKRKRRENG
jgi:zinc transport system permease protein